MQIPTIHSNGTSAQELIKQLREAYAALGTACDKLKEATPHGRDYYPQGPNAITAARDEHFTRLRKVEQVREEVLEIAIAIDRQVNEHRKISGTRF